MKLYYNIILLILLMGSAYALTPDGSTAAGDNMNIFITILFTISVLGLFYTFLLGLAKLATATMTFYDVILSWALYVLLIMTNHLTAHYVEDVFMYDLSNIFLTICVWINGVLPLISLVITMFVKSTQKKKPLSVGELSGFKVVRSGD